MPKKEKVAIKISKNELAVMKEVRLKYIDAIKHRSANPSSFNANIACLKELAQAIHYWGAIVDPHLDKKSRAEKKSKTTCFSFFRARAQDKVLKEIQVIEALQKQLLDEATTALLKEEFAKEPRIRGLNYRENNTQREIEVKFPKKHKYKLQDDMEEYKITFSDDSTILFNDLKPESLARAKIEFEKKMEELAQIMTSTLRMS